MPHDNNDNYDEFLDSRYESDSTEPVDYTELISKSALVGEYPFETIIESITHQFEDYIGNTDRTDYVDIFFNELEASRRTNVEDNDDEHPEEVNQVLDRYYDMFIDSMRRLFNKRLAISILIEDDENTVEDELEIAIRRLYEFFILNAKHNFKYVISHDIDNKLQYVLEDDNLFYRTIDDMLTQYSPVCVAITPTEFIKLTGNEEVLNMYESMQFTGNFLKKYSPKLYAHDDFNAEIIAEIAILQDIRKEAQNA